MNHIYCRVTSIFFALILLFFDIAAQNNSIKVGGNSSPSFSQASGYFTGGNSIKFTQNKGQVIDDLGHQRPDVLFKGNGDGADIYLRKTGMSFVRSDYNTVKHEIDEKLEEKGHDKKINQAELNQLKIELEQKVIVKIYRLDIDFVGGNSDPEIQPSDQLPGSTNFYYAHCPQGLTNVNSYNIITTKNIYKNIDVKYYPSTGLSTSGGKQNGLKYDIIVNPGGNPSDIKLKYTGAEEIIIENACLNCRQEKLKIKTNLGDVFEYMPKVYQNINGKIVDVTAEYILKGSTVSLKLGTWNHSLALVIDPWISYYGGNSYDGGTGVTTDAAGNVIFCGHTTSTNFPNTAGGFQTAFAGPTAFLNTKGDVFVVKMTSSGIPVWATYYGGTGNETAHSVASDASGNIFITGETLSVNFPTGFAGGNTVHQSAYGGGGTSGDLWFRGDAFMIALNTGGTRLWATYYGGTQDDTGSSVATDGVNIYMSGTTYSANAIVNGTSFQLSINGNGTTTMCDAFVVKFSPTGSPSWATYIGGTDKEKGCGITCDVTGNIYIAGGTSSTNFPIAAAFQPAYGGGGDAFVFKLSPAGARIWATYYGGSYITIYDLPISITTDGLNNVIFACILGGANVNTNDGSSSPGSYQPLFGGGTFETLIVKFNSNGARQWGTYLGGMSDEYVFSLCSDANNNIYVYGEWEDTDAKNYPISSCAYQPKPGVSGAGEDQYIAKYDPNGQQRCITYMGGSREDDLDGVGPKCVTVNGNNLYITGQTQGNYPVTPGAYQTVYGAVQDGTTANAFIAQLCINICEAKTLVIDPTVNSSTCTNVPVNFTPNVNNSCDTTNYEYKWTFAGGSPSSSTSTNPSVTYSTAGLYSVKLVVITPCKKDSITKNNYVVVNPCTITASAPSVTSCSNAGCTNITATGSSGTAPYTYKWSTGPTSATINVCPPVGTTTYTVTITDAIGNYALTTASVTINQSPVLTTSSYNITCTSSGWAYVDSVNHKSSSQGTAGQIIWNYSFNWSNNTSWYSQNGLASGNYTVTITDNTSGCSTSKTFNITGTSPVSATFTYPPVCIGVPVTFTNTGTTGTGITHDWYIGAPLSPQISGSTINFTTTFLSTGSYKVQHTVKDGTCTNLVTNNITVINCSAPTVTTTSNTICAGKCAPITATGVGGTTPYAYTWSNSGNTQTINPCPSSNTIYTVTITDAGSNTATSTAALTVNPAVSVNASQTTTSCSTLSATSNVTVGIGPFNYQWSGGTGSTQNVSGLSPGTYSVTVTDANSCTGATSVIIQPSLSAQFIKGTPACVECGCKEWIFVTATGGSTPYTYLWPNGYDKRYQNKLCPGIYAIKVVDKNGCTVNIIVNAP
jgi:hypothetical protein